MSICTEVPSTKPSSGNKEIMSAKIFISYARQDEDLKNQLLQHLGGLRHNGLIQTFDDHQISAGADWDSQIRHELETADIILFLISHAFLDSEYINKVEVRQAIQRGQEDKVVIIPIALRPCEWNGTPFAGIQCLPRNKKFIDQWEDPNLAFMEIAQAIHKHVEEVGDGGPPSPSADRTHVSIAYDGMWNITDSHLQVYFDGIPIGVGSMCNGFKVSVETRSGMHSIKVEFVNKVASKLQSWSRSIAGASNEMKIHLDKGSYNVKIDIARVNAGWRIDSIDKLS